MRRAKLRRKRRKAIPRKLKGNETDSNSIWGTLPDQIRPKSLVYLNYGLEFLFDELREAAERHKSGHHGGRLGTIQALEAVTLFLMTFKSVHEERLEAPLALLANALRALDRNTVGSLVRPVPRSGRAPASDVRQALKGLVAYTVRRLQDIGMDNKGSQQAVARRLKELGIKPDRGARDLTARTVREWCETTAADGPSGSARWMFGALPTNPQDKVWDTLPKKEAIQRLLDNMAKLIQPIRAFDLI
jgi:hypothetical protein